MRGAQPPARVLWTVLRVAPVLVLAAAPATARAQDASCSALRPIQVAGVVHDAVTREPVAGAEVRAGRGGDAPVFWTARSGPGGAYRLCLPAGEDTVRVRASLGDRAGPAVSLVPSADRLLHLDVPLTEAQDLVGTVVDAITERGVARAVVTLQPMGVRALSDEAGRFVFADLPEGAYAFGAEAPGYRPFEGEVLVRDLGRGAERIRVPLQPEAFELEPLVVEVDRRPYLQDVGFYERRDGERGGLFLTEVELQQPVWRAATMDEVTLTSWDARRRIVGRCAVVWVDGRPRGWSGTVSDGAAAPDLVTLDTPITARAALSWIRSGEVVGMEVLAPGEVPLEYQYVPPGLENAFSATSCGAILVWTDVGARRRR